MTERTIATSTLCFVVHFVATGSLCLGQSAPEVVEAWRGRQDQFESISFQISGTKSEPRGYVQLPEGMRSKAPIVPLPQKDSTTPILSDVLLDFANGRLRCRVETVRQFWNSETEQFVSIPSDQTSYFNGQQAKKYQPHASNLANAPVEAIGTELNIYKGRARTIVFGLEHNPILYACGIIHTTLNFDPADLKPELRRSSFRLRSEIELEGNKCLVLRSVPDPSKRFYEFWVDADDPRIIRQVHGYGLNQKGKLWVTTKIDWQETEHGPLPSAWEIQRFEDSTEKVSVYNIKVDKFEVNPAVTDADFDIDPPPGTRVSDDNLPKEARKYVVAAPGKPNLPVGEHMRQEERATSRAWLFMSIAAVVVLLIAALIMYRRRRVS
ncbi:hypothetical protein [Fuerstiella marisgermanici]|nr:hypothetical protein [Fuerstiella marisgermanici]